MSNIKRAIENAREGVFDPFTNLLAVAERTGARFPEEEEELLNVGGRLVTMGELDHADLPDEAESEDEE